MRPYVIITLQDSQKSFSYDIEVPTNVRTGKLTADIAEVLSSYNPKHSVRKDAKLSCLRLKRRLDAEETFGEAGIWTGDTLVIG